MLLGVVDVVVVLAVVVASVVVVAEILVDVFEMRECVPLLVILLLLL